MNLRNIADFSGTLPEPNSRPRGKAKIYQFPTPAGYKPPIHSQTKWSIQARRFSDWRRILTLGFEIGVAVLLLIGWCLWNLHK